VQNFGVNFGVTKR